MSTEFHTREEIDSEIRALLRQREEIGSEREFRFEDDYCIGGSDEPYTLREEEAMRHLRRELYAGGTGKEVFAESWEELRDRAWRKPEDDEEHGVYEFDVTRQGCQSSSLYVYLLDNATPPEILRNPHGVIGRAALGMLAGYDVAPGDFAILGKRQDEITGVVLSAELKGERPDEPYLLVIDDQRFVAGGGCAP